MNGFTYTLILEEPVLANSLSGDTNSARSLPFVPGGLIRGALIASYLKAKNIKEPADKKEFQRLFIKDQTRFLHAYPESSSKRTLPTPLSWKTYKDDIAGGIQNFAHTIKTDPDLKTASFALYVLDGSTVRSLKSEWQINIHTQRDAVFGRAKGAGQGAVYRYEALPAGLHLKGVILTANKTDAQTLKELLGAGSVMLGKARTAGYGKARIMVNETFDPSWREDASLQLPAGLVHDFFITLLSDAILRDEHGQLTLDPTAALKVKLKTSDLEIRNRFHTAEVVGGFNRQWGLPLPQSQALGAGSVFKVETTSGIESAELLQLEESGMGERIAEGFGRLAISTHQPEHYDLAKADLTFEPAPESKMGVDELTVASLMNKRLLRRNIEERMMSTVIDALGSYTGGVKNSQLSRWRVNLRSAIVMKQAGLEKIRDFYKKEDARNSPSWQKMTRARINMKGTPYRLTEWMSGLLESPDDVWDMMGYASKPVHRIGEQKSEPGTDLEIEYSLRLMDAVLASLAKKNAEGGRND